jgi:hypothetical protein
LIHSSKATQYININYAQEKGLVSEPLNWEVRKRTRGGALEGRSTLPPKPSPPKSKGKVQKKGWRMSDDTWTANSSPNPYNDYCHDDRVFQDCMLGGLSMDPRGLYIERDMEPNDKDPDQLDLEIAKKEL